MRLGFSCIQYCKRGSSLPGGVTAGTAATGLLPQDGGGTAAAGTASAGIAEDLESKDVKNHVYIINVTQS